MGSLDIELPLFSEDIGSDIAFPSRTLYQILLESGQKHPERTALVSCHQPRHSVPSRLDASQNQEKDEQSYLRWSYKELTTASEALASYLTKGGISKGEAIVVVVDSCAEWALCFWAAARLGCPFVPINPAIIGRANEIHHILSSLEGIGAFVAKDETIVRLLNGNAPAEVRNSKITMILGDVGMVGWTAFNDALAISKAVEIPGVEMAMEDTVLIVLTSGTTALPKGCPHSNNTVVSMCERHRIMYSLEQSRISCNHMPLFHLAGVMESLWAWAYGGTVVYPNESRHELCMCI